MAWRPYASWGDGTARDWTGVIGVLVRDRGFRVPVPVAEAFPGEA